MTTFELSEWIAAAPAAVFDFMTDPANAPRVIDSVQRTEKLTDGPLGAGTRLRETRIVNGQEAQTELLIEAYQPPHTYVVSAEQSGITVTYRYALRPENDGTRVQLHADVSSGGLKKLMLPLVAAVMKREDGDHLRKLKTAVEAA
ncbi:MAG: SRPBCC family protein [Anaerolineales bacterium]|nr:SRPBCC family protein [Anaerolineales bacterium]